MTTLEKELGEVVLPLLLMEGAPKLTWPVLSDQLYVKCFKSIFESFASSSDEEYSTSAKFDEVPPVAPAAVFPINGQEESSGVTRQKFDLPVYCIIGSTSDSPMLLRVSDTVDQPNRGLPLFSKKEGAVKFLDTYEDGELTEPHHVEEFDVDKVNEFIELLEFCCKHAEIVMFDPPSGGNECSLLTQFKDGFVEAMERVKRTIYSGTLDLIYETHDEDGVEFFSMLVSSGKYVAGLSQNSTLFQGNTRQEAIDAFKVSLDSQ